MLPQETADSRPWLAVYMSINHWVKRHDPFGGGKLINWGTPFRGCLPVDIQKERPSRWSTTSAGEPPVNNPMPRTRLTWPTQKEPRIKPTGGKTKF
jgi:hypothetical protein